MMRKLARVVQSGYINQLTTEKIMDVAVEFGVTGIATEDGTLVFDAGNRWQLLKLLDDDYLRSPMTTNRYESSAKVRVQLST